MKTFFLTYGLATLFLIGLIIAIPEPYNPHNCASDTPECNYSLEIVK